MKTISFKVTELEAEAIRQQASLEHLSVSEFLRRRACGSMEGGEEIGRVRCEFTGAKIFSSSSSGLPLDVESTREILKDFP